MPGRKPRQCMTKTKPGIPARGPVEEVYRRLDLQSTEDSGKDTRIDASETYARALVVIEKVLRLLDELEEKEP